jgi:CubicO group peptidase (beta-lactamase class C family)
MNRNDRAAAGAALPEMISTEALKAEPLQERINELSRRFEETRGADPVRFQRETENDAILVYRNRLTGRLAAVRVRTETAAPFRIIRITDLPIADPTVVPPRHDAELAARVDRFVVRLTAADAFSGVVLLARGEAIVLHKAYGFADRNLNVANTLETRFRHASMTKMFTALAIGQLVERGLVSFDDPVSRFLPYPDPENAQSIQIKHLLSHTAGLGNFVNSPAFEDARATRFETLEQMLAVAGNNPPRYPPGSSGGYSNTGYLLLGRIVELVSGQSYREYVEENIFRRAGMADSGFFSFLDVGKRLAPGYQVRIGDGGRRVEGVIAHGSGRGHPAGSTYGTALDMFRFGQALRSNALVSAETLRLMTTPVPWIKTNYGYGFWMGRDAPTGRRSFGHPGNTTGGCTIFEVITDSAEPVTAVVLANSSTLSCIPIIEEIYRLVPAQAESA